jgi:hypothetical protein
MRLIPNHPNNYNGMVHPKFLEHLKPHIQDLRANIYGKTVPESSAVEWAELGMLEEIHLHSAGTTNEALITKGRGHVLAQLVRSSKDADPALDFLYDYYFGTAEEGMSALLKVLNDPGRLIDNINVISSICIADMGFKTSEKLNAFLFANLTADERKRANFELHYHLHHYLRHPDDIREWAEKSSTPFDFAKLAIFQAHVGDFDSARTSLDRAGRLAGKDFFAWQQITRGYLFLLGDFDGFEDAMKAQIESCDCTFAYLESVWGLCHYIGSDEAIEKARDLMHLAELASDDADDLNMVAQYWEDDLNDPERGAKCRKMAGVRAKLKGA